MLDAGLLSCRELVPLLRQSVYSRLVGYEDDKQRAPIPWAGSRRRCLLKGTTRKSWPAWTLSGWMGLWPIHLTGG